MNCPENQTNVNNKCISNTCIVTISTKPTECADRGICKDAKCICKTSKLDPTTNCEFCTDDKNLLPVVSSDFANCTHCIDKYYKAKDKSGQEICVLFKCIGAYNTVCNRNGVCGVNGCECDVGKAYLNEMCLICTDQQQEISGVCYAKSCIKDDKICNERGTCDNSTSCTCDEGSEGSFCETCSNDYILVQTSDKCALKKCVYQEEICNGQTCDEDGNCICRSGKSGTYCQCEIGYRQAGPDDLRCFKDNCISSKKECYNRGTCIEKDSTFTCQDCGKFIFNDPEKGCEKCRAGSVIIPDSNKKCVSSKCMMNGTDRPCNSRGECEIVNGSPKCVCRTLFEGEFCENCAGGDPNLTNSCNSCKSGYEKQNGKCVSIFCFKNGIECSDKGKCANEKCVCQQDFSGNLCQFCNDAKKDPKTSCKTCLNNFLLIGGSCYNNVCPQGQKFSEKKLMCEKIEIPVVDPVLPNVVDPEIDVDVVPGDVDGNPAGKQKSNVGLISGLSIAAILVVAAIVSLIVFAAYKKSKQQINTTTKQKQIVISHDQVFHGK